MQKRSFHHFDLVERIGLGGMSEVYRGVHQTLGYPVAIKILDPRLAQNRTFIGRFEFEARAASNLANNRIVSVIDFGVEDDTYFIVMEYVDGHDLKWVMDQIEADPALPGHRGLPAEIALMILEEVAMGLKAAHDQKIIHRDIKPSNILVSRNGEVKLTDFGLGRDYGGIGRFSTEDLTLPGTVMGTPAYMSPEQAAGARDDIDYRTDIFSLGVVAYHLLTGEKPFPGDDLASVLERIVKEEPRPITTEKCPLANPEIQLLVERMLRKDPAKRFSSMAQVLTAIQAAMENLDNSLFRYRNEYMARFAADPAGFSKELVRLSIKSHLKLGHYFKNLGTSNINDALQHFSFVHALDPGNDAAREAIEELRRQERADAAGAAAEIQDTGRRRRTPPDKVLADVESEGPKDTVRLKRGRGAPASPPAPPPPAPPAARPGGSRRPRLPLLVAGGVAVLAAATFALIGLPDRSEAPPPAPPESTLAAVPAVAPPPLSKEPLPPPGPRAGTLSIQTTPPGARLAARPRASRKGFSLLGISPARADLAEGEWEVEVMLPGYAGDTLLVSIVPGETTEQQATLPRWTTSGTLTVDTMPAGASAAARPARSKEAFRPLGLTPLTRELPAGPWEVRIEKEGFRTETRILDLAAGNPGTLTLPLRKAGEGYIAFRVKPEADVFLDDAQILTGRKEAVVRAEAGRSHRLELRHPSSFGRIVRDVEVAADDTTNLGEIVFRWGTLSVSCNQTATIYLDGARLNRDTPCRLERIGTGEHRLSVRRPGLMMKRAELQDAKGKPVRDLEGRRDADGFFEVQVDVPVGSLIGVRFELAPGP